MDKNISITNQVETETFYEKYSDSYLQSLFNQFGRNGPMNDIQQRAYDKVMATLINRRKEGLIYTDDGQIVCIGQG